ncbi:MAG: glycosyltransferase family 4 protein [Deltaproteobacteria bacterium]|nr:glycosyltransferase family 4 protein [Deltaproteobacteria bacterium]
MSRVLYICHDNPNPSGGIRVLYRHVEELNRAGFKAAVVHFQPDFTPSWFSHHVPVINVSQKLDLFHDDWIVIPEDHTQALNSFSQVPCRKVIFCQNHFYVFNSLPPEKTWLDFGVSEVMVSSVEILKFVKNVFNLEATLVPVGIDPELFFPIQEERNPAVAFMPRKGVWAVRTVMGILWHRAPQLRSVKWVPIDGMTEDEAARAMRQCAVFMSTGVLEGFGLPPIEAMASGCIVVGFTGGGGREYAHDGNGFWCPDQDPFALADRLEHILTLILDNPSSPHLESVRQAGFETARRYSLEAQRQRLLEFWAPRLS